MKTKPNNAIIKRIKKELDRNINIKYWIEDSIYESFYQDEDYDTLLALGKEGFNALIKNSIKAPKHPKNFDYIFNVLKREAEQVAQNRKLQEAQRLDREFARAQKEQAIQDAMNKKTKFLASLTK